MLRVVLAIARAFRAARWAYLGLADAAPALPGLYLLVAMAAPGLGAAWFGLMQLHRRIALDAVGTLLLVVGWYYSLLEPLFTGSMQPRWGVVAAQLAWRSLLREVALGALARGRLAAQPARRAGVVGETVPGYFAGLRNLNTD